MLHSDIQAWQMAAADTAHAAAPLPRRASFASQQVVGFQEEVQLREQDFGNFQDADAKEREKEDRCGLLLLLLLLLLLQACLWPA